MTFPAATTTLQGTTLPVKSTAVPLITSTRDGARPQRREPAYKEPPSRAFFPSQATERDARSRKMETKSTTKRERDEFSTPEWELGQMVKPEKPSRAAELIAALYVAFVLCAPWLVRDALILTPPSNGVEIAVVSNATQAPVDKEAPAALPSAN
jgi:hypothetical protein